MRTLYIKMKTESGSSVYRNIAPQTGSNKISFATSSTQGETASRAAALADAFVPIQTEVPDIKDNQYQFKLVEEYTFEFAEAAPVTLAGGDAWSDTTDEKLVTYLTDGDKSYTVKLAKAASAINPSYSGQYIPAIREFASKVAENYKTSDLDATVDGGYVDWTSVHLTGTRDSLIAQPD